MAASFLSSRVKNLNIGVSGYTDNTNVLDVIGNITSSGSFTSTIPDGTAPLQVISTTLVENLNVELLDGRNGDFYLNLDNSTGTFSPGDIIYAPSENTIAKLNIGNDGNLLTVVNGLPSWEQITAEDLGGISGIDVYDDDKDPTFIGKVKKFNFEFGLFAELDSVDQDLAIISLDLSSITPESIGAITGIGILEESVYIGEVQNIDFIGGNITAAIDVEGTATVTLTDDPTFNTVRVTVAPGTAPFIVNSNTLVSKLNADFLDGQHGSYYTNASNLSTGTVPVARLAGEYDIDISGNALTATNSSYINVTKRNDNTSYKVTFTDSIGGNQGIYIDEDLNQFTYTPVSGKLSSPILASSVAVGTAPLEVTSTTLVSNLNVDLLDNQHGSYYLDLDNATNVLDETKGGTGIDGYATGDILYASGVDTLAKLPIGTNNNVLYIEGNQIVWKALTPENVGAIDGVILQNDEAALGKVSTLSFNTNLVASIRESNTDAGDISLADDITLNSVTTTSDSTINGQRIGRGGGNIETNTVLGFEGLLSNTGGSNNVAIGYQSSYLNENGNYNVSVGVQSLFNNEGNNNTAFGHNALFANQTGNYNTSIGSFTGSSVVASRNIIIGSGTDENNLFDVPNLNQNFQMAIGHNVSGTSNYWIVGDENYNIGLGTNNPTEKLDVVGNVIISGNLDIGTVAVPAVLDLQGSAFISQKVSVNTTSQTAQVNVSGDVHISANSSNDLVRLNQTGTGNVLVVEDSVNPDLSAFTIDADGNVGVKISNPLHSLDVGGDAKLHNKLYDYVDSSGSNGDLLVSTGDNVVWTSTANITAGDATNAANINITEKNDNVSYSVVFTSTSTGNQEVYIDTDTSDLVYNPSTGKLSSQIFISTIADGTAPLEVTSTTLVSNLNADLLDNQQGTYYLDLDNATNVLVETKGGTGLNTYTTGDILYSSSSNTLSSLSIGNSGNILTVEGGVPVWKNVQAGDVGAISGIDIQEDGTSLGLVTTINFGDRLIATLDLVDSNIANITFTDDPSFNTLELTVAVGTAPLTVTSTTLVSNLNADLLDNQQGTYYLDLDNATGTLAATKGGTGISTYAKGDIIYSSAVDTLEALALGTENQLLTVDATGVPVWKTVTAADLGAIAGVNVQEDDTPLGLVETINFGTGIVAEIDPVDSTVANINIDASALASNTVNILEDGTPLGAFENINFIGSNLTAADAGSGIATVTLTDDPSFNTIELTVADGTAPLTVTSTTLVSNLNADLLDGEQGTYYLDLDNATNILDETKGGTSLSTYTTGDILYASATDTLSSLAIGSPGNILTVEGGVPVWKNVQAGDVGAIAGVDVQENGTSLGLVTSINFGDRLIATLDTNNSSLANITFTDDPSFNTIELTVADGTAPLVVTSTTLVSNLNADLLDGQEGTYYLNLDNATNILDETKGGTGLSTYTTGDILYASATDTLSALALGTENQVLTVDSSGVPIWKNSTIDILENGTSLGLIESINFGDRLIASINPLDLSSVNITFTDDPSFNTLELTVAVGTAPLTVTSTTLVSNLNADLLDNQQGTYYLDLDNATNILDETKGGTSLSTYTTGDILYSSAADTLSTLPIGSPGNILTVEGGVPVWKSLDASVTGSITISNNTLDQSQYLTYAVSTGDTTELGVTTEGLVFNPFTGRMGIGQTLPQAKLDINVGTGLTALNIEGSEGQLFSVTNNLTSGSIFSVSDVSGVPSIDVDADGTIQLAPFGSTEYVGIGTTNPTQKLDVNGNIRLRGALYDNSNSIGATNQVLTSTGSGISWQDAAVSGVDIQSDGTPIGTGFTTLNFIGEGNNFAVNGTTVDINIAGGSSTPDISPVMMGMIF